MPPASLIFLAASFMAFACGTPTEAPAPVSDSRSPTLIVCDPSPELELDEFDDPHAATAIGSVATPIAIKPRMRQLLGRPTRSPIGAPLLPVVRVGVQRTC